MNICICVWRLNEGTVCGGVGIYFDNPENCLCVCVWGGRGGGNQSQMTVDLHKPRDSNPITARRTRMSWETRKLDTFSSEDTSAIMFFNPEKLLGEVRSGREREKTNLCTHTHTRTHTNAHAHTHTHTHTHN